ncbi:MAG: hypothetical protein WCB96_10110, partial [Candidatus Aminicenantales bacterium]
RFRLELAAGFALLDPAGLNLLVDSDNRFQEFSYESYYDYLGQNNLLRSWSRDATGERHKVKTAILPGLRLKYFLFDFLAVSAGFQYLRGGGSQNLIFTYTRSELTNEQYIETLAAAPYRLTAEAELASVGLHLSTKIGRAINAEGFLAAGLMWAVCRYQSAWTYTWVIQGPNYTWTPYESSGSLEMDGSGKGFFWETGARLDIPVGGGFRASLEGGYARQAVNSISGSGGELLGQSSESWEGQWRIQKETVVAPWGTLALRTPSNRQREGVETEDFRLDLSGFRLRLGLSLAF